MIDAYVASGAEAATAMLKYNNIATVVGEATMGVFGTGADPFTAIISLPHTGIVLRFDTAYFTDTEGRPFEGYGVTPHYFNRPGMDALETVLAMIREGER
ncbi:MAG: S41 family peptidase [Oscillospiraceae bacterium]|nr:S41 family peptidase [Oscillospiraceae bacterium]